MIVFGSHDRKERISGLLARLGELLSGLEDAAVPEYDRAVELLIVFGMLEAGIIDSLHPEQDGFDRTVRSLREAGTWSGSLFLSANGGVPVDRAHAARFRRALERIPFLPGVGTIPDETVLRTPEGYAYYSLYPETYAVAAYRFVEELRPGAVVTIGLRSIGTSLSSAVNAALGTRGIGVFSCTLRPRGEYFRRFVRLDGRLEAEIRKRTDHFFLVIDEGPGLSGSSFGSVSEALSLCGVPDSRIVLFPSHDADSSRFVSGAARERWDRHRKFLVPFESLYLETSRLPLVFGAGGPVEDLSAGAWRNRVFRGGGETPPVLGMFEKRKYLVENPSGGGPVLLKFIGLPPFGNPVAADCAVLADAGFHPPVAGCSHGFLAEAFLPGVPLACGSGSDPGFLAAAARYFAFLCRRFPATPSRTSDENIEMIGCNVREGLGQESAEALLRTIRGLPSTEAAIAVKTDGHNFPWEWLRCGTGYLKTDCAEHAFDHLYPGCQDIAYDLSSFIVEFNLGGPERELFLARYRALSGDDSVGERLPFFLLVYLSFRLGYTVFASGRAGGSDGEGFRLSACRYSRLLREFAERP